MYEIKFKYKDAWTGDKWSEQTCVMNSVSECKRLYGLGVDCDYEIISVKKV